MKGLIDTHCHLFEPVYDDVRDGLMEQMRQNGLYKLICVGCEPETVKQSIALAEKYEYVYVEAGFHPCDTADISDSMWEQMKKLIAHPKVVAVGEIGLDYHWESSPRDKQKYWFEKQLAYANEAGLPIVIHSRDAMEDTLEIIRKNPPPRGVFHCFSGSVETLREILKMNFSISLGGVVTFSNARRVVECAKAVPEDRLMLETDSPYLTPAPHRGKVNRPDYTRFVAEKIAEIRGVTTDEVIEFTTRNAEQMFGI